MKRIYAVLFFFCLFCADVPAENFYRKFDNFIRRIMTAGLDSTYIVMPVTSWEIPACVGTHGHDDRIVCRDGTVIQDKPGGVYEAGIGLGYHGLDFLWKKEFGGNRPGGNYFEFNFYDNYWGFQMVTSSRDFEGIGFSSATFGGYFAFNGKRYSYPAAIYGNYHQKKSAGSAMIFFWYDKNRAWSLDGSTSAGISLNLNNFSLCGGYGYNLVFGQGRAVMNFTAVAGLIAPYWGVSVQGRASVLYWFNDYFRINASTVQYVSNGWKNSTEKLFSTEWMANVGLAFCFGK